MLRDLSPSARRYIVAVIVAGAVTFALLIPRAVFAPIAPLLFLVLLSSLTAAFKVQLPIATSGSMSVSYIVDIAALILRGPHATMIVGAASGWSQTVFNSRERNPAYRSLFNMAVLVLTVQTAGQVYTRLGGTAHPALPEVLVPLLGMSFTYFFMNTVPIAVAVALTTRQSAWRVWKTEFASSAATYVLGAAAAAVVIQVTESSGYWLTLLLTAAPLYLTYKVYRAGVETEARQGAILEAAHDAIITIDQRFNIREFNPAAEQMFGYRRTEILGKSVVPLLGKENLDEQLRALKRYMTTGEGPLGSRRRLELTGCRADATEFPVEISVARVGADSRLVVTGFVRDITERRALEEQLRQSQKLEAIGRLAGGVAHDFNNILMSIMGSTDLLLMQLAADDPARGEANEIKLAVQRGAGLTRQLLAFSRRLAARPRLISLGDVVHAMEIMVRRLIGPEVDFAVNCRNGTPDVMADPGQVEQVVLNLVVNARDAMPQGGKLSITVDDVELDQAAALAAVEGRAGRYARLSVADTGTGIDEATRGKLFEPFFTTKEQGKGTGLGLSIVYGIVKQSGGYITVQSEPGRGATFTIYLPAAAVAEPAERAAQVLA